MGVSVLRVLLVVAAGLLAWYVAGHWNRWTGAARYEATDDAYTAGDVTPLAAKVSGYVATVAVNDYQAVHKGDLIVEIDPSDYRARSRRPRPIWPRRRRPSPISPTRRTCSAR